MKTLSSQPPFYPVVCLEGFSADSYMAPRPFNYSQTILIIDPKLLKLSQTCYIPSCTSGILLKGNEAWRRSPLTASINRRTQLTPMNKFDQALGLKLASAFSNHILRSYNKVKHKQPLACTCNDPREVCESFPIPPTLPTDSTNHLNTDNTDNRRPQTGLPICIFGGDVLRTPSPYLDHTDKDAEYQVATAMEELLFPYIS